MHVHIESWTCAHRIVPSVTIWLLNHVTNYYLLVSDFVSFLIRYAIGRWLRKSKEYKELLLVSQMPNIPRQFCVVFAKLPNVNLD